jgi:hypothetical protein
MQILFICMGIGMITVFRRLESIVEDLNLLVFFWGGQLKQLVYSVEINTHEQLLDQITNRFYEIRQDVATIAPDFTTQWFAGVILAFELILI